MPRVLSVFAGHKLDEKSRGNPMSVYVTPDDLRLLKDMIHRHEAETP